MESYNVLIDEMLIGDTPREKYNNLSFMINILQQIAYPKRGTDEESKTIYDFAQEIQKNLPSLME
jgi:hypothetical protein